jgi:membrane-associated protease RseP (regulator of RpoE activity)
MRRIFGLHSKRGQSLVEFALILPVMMFLLLGMVEMGFAISHNVSIQTATRQGARVGSILVNGDTHCAPGNSAALAATVDPGIIAAVEGALTSTGSSVDMSQVTSVEIFGVSSNGTALGTDKFKYDSVSKHFIANGAAGWPAVGRCGAVTGALPNGGAPRIGVKITYNYKFLTPLGSFLNNNGQITMTDQTTMALEPPKP